LEAKLMKLYIKPGACSLSPHIVFREAGLPVEIVKADARSPEFRKINPKGFVPVLQLDDGQFLTEGAVIVQYLADQKPEAKLAPRRDSFERYRLLEWLNYIATDLHKGYGGMAKKPPEEKQALFDSLSTKFTWVSSHLQENQFLLGERFTVADAYLFTVLSWSPGRGVDLAQWPALKSYFDRIGARPAVKEALEAERS
jgi:glutathione S-transferase